MKTEVTTNSPIEKKLEIVNVEWDGWIFYKFFSAKDNKFLKIAFEESALGISAAGLRMYSMTSVLCDILRRLPIVSHKRFLLVPLRKTTVSSTSAKPKKQSQSSGMKEGQPLPANGSCKHYKKSYRWLR